jgi:uncharacterized protein YoxC
MGFLQELKKRLLADDVQAKSRELDELILKEIHGSSAELKKSIREKRQELYKLIEKE